jgi:hypothetical protein
VAAAVRLNLYDYTIAVNGTFWPRTYSCIWEPRFQPGTNHVVAPVRCGQRWGLAMDGHMRWKNTFVQLWNPVFSPDGSRLACVVARAFGSWALAVDDRVWKTRPFAAISGLTFSPDGRRIAAVALKKGRQTLVFDETALKNDYERVWQPVFSPDGCHLAAKIRHKGRFTVLLDGKLWHTGYDALWDPVFDEKSETIMIRGMDQGFYHKHVVALNDF